MARRRRGRPIDGILILDKPAGVTSNKALQRVKYLFKAAKVGHTGSLDPLATGVLPLCFGEATKLSQFLLDADKVYDSTFVLGVATTTGDAEGEERLYAGAGDVTRDRLDAAVALFTGAIDQVPSMYSAIKYEGQPLYALARQGIEVPRKSRRITVHSYEVIDFRPGARAEVDVRVHCSKGTYIRSLAEDLGDSLGCGGHVSRLRRIQSGPFTLEHAVGLPVLESLRERGEDASMDSLLQPSQRALADMPQVTLSESAGFYLRQGQAVLVPNAPCDGMVRCSLGDGEFLGIGEILDDGRIAPRRLMVTKG